MRGGTGPRETIVGAAGQGPTNGRGWGRGAGEGGGGDRSTTDHSRRGGDRPHRRWRWARRGWGRGRAEGTILPDDAERRWLEWAPLSTWSGSARGALSDSHGHCLAETTWAAPKSPLRLRLDASVGTFHRLCIGLAESSEFPVSMTGFKRGYVHFFSSSSVGVQLSAKRIARERNACPKSRATRTLTPFSMRDLSQQIASADRPPRERSSGDKPPPPSSVRVPLSPP